MHKSVFARILICSLSLAVSAVVMLAQDAGSKSAKTDQHPDFLQIITPHEGVDFTGFSDDLVRRVKRNWSAETPLEAKEGIRGRVVVRFSIQRDGQLANMPNIEVSSGKKPLDDAAVSAVKASAPFEHLPEAFKGPSIELRLTFLYNTPLSAPTP
jgi:TonB family protein